MSAIARFARCGVVAAALAASAAVDLCAQPLEVELERLVRNNPRILADRERISAAGEGIRGAAAAFLPRIALTADSGVDNVDSPATRSSELVKPIQRDQVSLTFTQNLYDADRKDHVKREAELNRAVAEVRLESTTQELLLTGIEAYLDVYSTALLYDLALINEEAIVHQVDLEEKKLAAGASTSVDVALARSRLQLAQERRVVAQQQYEVAQVRYTQVFDRRPDASELRLPVPPLRLVPDTLEEAVDMAIALHPEIASSERQIDIARTRQREVAADFFPRVDLVGRSSYREDVDASRGTRRDWSVLLQASWDLFSGFSKQASSSQAAFSYAASIFDRETAARRIKEQVRVQWTLVKTACQRIVLLRSAVDIASNVEDSRIKLRAAGRATDLEVLDTQTQTFNTMISLVTGLTDGMKNVYRLIGAAGRLDVDTVTKEAATPINDRTKPTSTVVTCDGARLNPFELEMDNVKVLRVALTDGGVNRTPTDDAPRKVAKPGSANPFDAPKDEPDKAPAAAKPVPAKPAAPPAAQPASLPPPAAKPAAPTPAKPAATPPASAPADPKPAAPIPAAPTKPEREATLPPPAPPPTPTPAAVAPTRAPALPAAPGQTLKAPAPPPATDADAPGEDAADPAAIKAFRDLLRIAVPEAKPEPGDFGDDDDLSKPPAPTSRLDIAD